MADNDGKDEGTPRQRHAANRGYSAAVVAAVVVIAVSGTVGVVLGRDVAGIVTIVLVSLAVAGVLMIAALGLLDRRH